MTTWDALDRAANMERLITERDYAFARANDANRRTIVVGSALASAVKTLELLASPPPVALSSEIENDIRVHIAGEAAASAYDALAGYPFTDPQ